jgi:hypothetical protein
MRSLQAVGQSAADKAGAARPPTAADNLRCSNPRQSGTSSNSCAEPKIQNMASTVLISSERKPPSFSAVLRAVRYWSTNGVQVAPGGFQTQQCHPSDSATGTRLNPRRDQ